MTAHDCLYWMFMGFTGAMFVSVFAALLAGVRAFTRAIVR